MVFHRDTPFFIPGSSVCERQFDIYASQRPGRYTRPHGLTPLMRTVSVNEDGGFQILYRNGKLAVAPASSVAAWAIEM